MTQLGDLQAFVDLRRELKRRQELDAAQRAAQRAAQERARREAELFRRAVGEVTPLRTWAHAPIGRARPEPLPLMRQRDERDALRSSWSDEFDPQTLLETDESLSFRRRHVGPDVVHRLRCGRWALQGQIDLHGLRREEAREALASFVRLAVREGRRCVRVVHGKGQGSPGRQPVLKSKVRNWLMQCAEVLAFVQARASEGGVGALIVLLSPPPQRSEAPDRSASWASGGDLGLERSPEHLKPPHCA